MRTCMLGSDASTSLQWPTQSALEFGLSCTAATAQGLHVSCMWSLLCSAYKRSLDVDMLHVQRATAADLQRLQPHLPQ